MICRTCTYEFSSCQFLITSMLQGLNNHPSNILLPDISSDMTRSRLSPKILRLLLFIPGVPNREGASYVLPTYVRKNFQFYFHTIRSVLLAVYSRVRLWPAAVQASDCSTVVYANSSLQREKRGNREYKPDSTSTLRRGETAARLRNSMGGRCHRRQGLPGCRGGRVLSPKLFLCLCSLYSRILYVRTLGKRLTLWFTSRSTSSDKKSIKIQYHTQKKIIKQQIKRKYTLYHNMQS
jgi:hypothetical protein